MISLPGASNKLDDRSKEEESTVESEPHGLPVRSQKPIQHFEPLQHENDAVSSVPVEASELEEAGL